MNAQFFGRQVQRPRAGVRQALHRHNEARLVVYLAGDMREEAFEGARVFRRGAFVFRPAFFAHANIAQCNNVAYSHLDVSAQAVRDWIGRHGWRAGTGYVDLDRQPHGDEVLRAATPQPYASGAETGGMRRVARMLCDNPNARLGEIACAVGLAPYELTRHFTRAFGLSPNVYRRQARLQRAMGMLAEHADGLARIAQAAGYHDQSHLSHDLKRETGLTPKAFALS